MTPSNIYTDLAAGKSSRELDAAICVECQYVPGVPEARNVRSINSANGGFALMYDGYYLPFSRESGCRDAPDLLNDMNACMAFERAMMPYAGAFTLLRRQGEFMAQWSWRVDDISDPRRTAIFIAPYEPSARVGAVMMAREGAQP